jgi:hypothetical protein
MSTDRKRSEASSSSLFGSTSVQRNVWKMVVVTDGSTRYVR